MTSWVVVDSSLFLSTVLPDQYSLSAQALLNSWSQAGFGLIAPTLFMYEITSVMRNVVHRKHLTLEEATQKRDLLLSRRIQFVADYPLVRRAYDLATQFNRPDAYDGQYLAVAEKYGCEYWTADQKLFNAIKGSLPWVHWVEDKFDSSESS